MIVEEPTSELITRIDRELAETPHPFKSGGSVSWLCALCGCRADWDVHT